MALSHERRKIYLLVFMAAAIVMIRSYAMRPSVLAARHSNRRIRHLSSDGYMQTCFHDRKGTLRASAENMGESDKDDLIREDNLPPGFIVEDDEPGGTFADLGGGIFPNDITSSKGETTLRQADVSTGQPEALIGVWQLYATTGGGEDASDRVILRADGMVVGGPAVKLTPDVKWSDPDGLRPVGGQWEVYQRRDAGQSRLKFNMILSKQQRQELEMDGIVMTVDGWNDEQGRRELQHHVFGSIWKKKGEKVEDNAGDFSMMKVVREDDKLFGAVGSRRQRLW